MQVRAVTAFVPLDVRHLTPQQYKDYGAQLKAAIPEHLQVFEDFPYDQCWLAHADHLPPAQSVPADRYASPGHMVMSNIVQHQRTTWAMMASYLAPEADVIVWIDYAILKQGDFTGKRVTQKHVADLVKLLSSMAPQDLEGIPFPGIWQEGAISDTGDNWRFCGSLHIWPRQYLEAVDRAYRKEVIKFVERTRSVPNDLPIWAYVEQQTAGVLPFRWYKANHDATQFTNFPGGDDASADTALRASA